MMNLDVSAVIRQKQVPWRTQWMARKTGSGEERPWARGCARDSCSACFQGLTSSSEGDQVGLI